MPNEYFATPDQKHGAQGLRDKLIDEADANQKAFWELEEKRLAELRKILIASRMGVIASGGVSCLEDIQELRRLETPGAAVVSLYARGRDYHKVLRQRLQALGNDLIRLADHPRSRATIHRAARAGVITSVLPGIYTRQGREGSPAIRIRAACLWSPKGAIHGLTAVQIQPAGFRRVRATAPWRWTARWRPSPRRRRTWSSSRSRRSRSSG